jgi:hypothetical protein
MKRRLQMNPKTFSHMDMLWAFLTGVAATVGMLIIGIGTVIISTGLLARLT